MTDQNRVRSRAERVTFFEDRAEVRRVAVASLQPGVQTVHVEGVSLLVDDSSLVVRLRSGGVGRSRVLTSKVRRNFVRESSTSAEDVAALEAELDRSEYAKTAAERAHAHVAGQKGRVLAAESALLDALVHAPVGVSDWADAFAAIDAQLDPKFDLVAEAKHAVELARRDADRARERWRAALVESPRIVSTVEVQLELTDDVDPAQELEIEMVYLVPCALWRPSHVARLDTKSSPEELRILNEATVWQRTGERWEDIEALFSTARPSRAVSPPLLEDDELYARPKQEMRVEGRDVAIETAGAKGARALDEMPGVDDGGEPLQLTASGPVTIPSDGEPTRIDIGEVRLSAEVSTVAYPEYGATPHVRARATWKAERPLLAGPVRVMRGAIYVGVARLDFVAPGAVLEMGFGRDSSVSIRRTTKREEKTSSMTGHRKIVKSTTLYCSNLSDETRKLWVVERIPVSEVEEVKVALVDAAGGALNDDGLLSFAIELLPHASEKREISYRVEHGSSVHLSL